MTQRLKRKWLLTYLTLALVTLIVACGDLEEKKITGPNIKKKFLQTHSDTFISPSQRSLTFHPKGEYEERSYTLITVTIERASSNQFYIYQNSSNKELIVEQDFFLKESTKTTEKQMSTVTCQYLQKGELTHLYKLPREHPLDKVDWNLRSIMKDYPQANYLMHLSPAERSVDKVEIHHSESPFFKLDHHSLLNKYLISLCAKSSSQSHLSNHSYNGAFVLALASIEGDTLEFLNRSDQYNAKDKTAENPLHKLADRVFTRKGKKFDFYKPFQKFFDGRIFRSHLQTHEYIENIYRKYVPTNSKEHIIAKVNDGQLTLIWTNETCPLNIELVISNVDTSQFEVDSNEIPLALNSINVLVFNLDNSNESCTKQITFYNELNEMAKGRIDNELSLKTYDDYYSESFTLILRGSKSKMESLRFISVAE